MRATNESVRLRSVIGCLVVQLAVGVIYLWSIFSADIVLSFHWSAENTKMVSSYMMLAYVGGNLIGGFLNDRKGPKFTCLMGVSLLCIGFAATAFLTDATINWIYLTYCTLGGVGSGFAYGACISCIQKWLPERRGFASGLAVSAFGMSTVIFAPVSQWLMECYTDEAGVVAFQPVFLWLAAVFFIVGIGACLLISVPQGYGSGATGSASVGLAGPDYTFQQAIKTAPFWCMFASIFFGNGTWNLTVPLIKGLAMERGLSESLAVFCVSFTGVASAAGRLVGATLSDKIGRPASIGLLTAFTLVCSLLMTFVSGGAYIVVVAIIAFAFGGPCATNAAVCTDFFGTKHSGATYGVMMLALGLSSVFFNWVSAHILQGAVVPTFLMASAAAVVPIVMMILIHRFQKRWPPEN